MEVQIPDTKLKRALEDDKERKRRFGANMAKKIQLRMDALKAAESLGDFWPPLSGPERCHELKADLAGTFSMDLVHPYRLLFKPMDPEHHSVTGHEKARWAAIKSIIIAGIEDTHG
jgi:proteic killer suppression protein